MARQLGEGTSPLQRSGVQSLPYNPATGRAYHGVNAISLMLQNRADDRWLTWDEAKMAGLSIRKGEKPTPIQYWQKKREGEETRRAITAWVFNGEQLLGMPPMPRKPERPDPMERVLGILEHGDSLVVYDRIHRGYYSERKDEIHLAHPEKTGKEQFCEDAINQYFKSSGHPERLNRDSFGARGMLGRAREEFICGVATMLMCAELGIPAQPARNADLVETWQQSITANPLGFARDMMRADEAVWATLRREHARNRALNSSENEVWRPIPEEFPFGAVSSFLDRKQVLHAIDNDPGSLDRFPHDGSEIFAMRESGRLLGKAPVDPDNPDAGNTLTVKTRGFDRDGNEHDVLLRYGVKLDANGMAGRTTELAALKIQTVSKSMALPPDWNGGFEARGCRENESGGIEASDAPEFHCVFARTAGGETLTATFDTHRDAVKYIQQVQRQYEYLSAKRGLDIETARNPDRAFPKAARTAFGDMPDLEPTEQTRRECITAMELVGMIVTGKHPIIDGKGHRVDVEGDRPGQGTGWYVAHVDGRPAGTCINNRTKARVNWKSAAGLALDEETRAGLHAIARMRKENREKETAEGRKQAASRLAWMMKSVFTRPDGPTPYLEKKGLPHDPGVYQNKGSTCIPLYDADGNVRSMAYVKENGAKRYAKGADKEGHFYVHGGGAKALRGAPAIVVAEGYATGATARMAIAHPVVSAFDSGNLTAVVTALKEKYPGKPVVVLGDDDRHLEARKPPERNSGREEALKATQAVGGTAVFPRWGVDAPPGKEHSDFDDLRREYGLEAVRGQVMPVIEQAIEQAREKEPLAKDREKTRGDLSR